MHHSRPSPTVRTQLPPPFFPSTHTPLTSPPAHPHSPHPLCCCRYVGEFVEAATLNKLFGVDNLENCSKAELCLAERDNDMSRRILAIIETIRRQRVGGLLPTVRVVTHRAPLVHTLKSMLVEDRSFQDKSYVEYLCHVHKEIQQKLQDEYN